MECGGIFIRTVVLTENQIPHVGRVKQVVGIIVAFTDLPVWCIMSVHACGDSLQI